MTSHPRTTRRRIRRPVASQALSAIVSTAGLGLLAPAALLGQVAPQDSPPSAHSQATPDTQSALDTVSFRLGGLPVHIVEADEETGEISVEFRDQPGSRAVIEHDQLPREARYRLKEVRLGPDSTDDWRQLAEYARELRLHLRRYEALGQAIEATEGEPDEELQGLHDTAREAVAAHRVTLAKRAADDGARRQAIYILEDTHQRFAPCPSADRAAELAATWEQRGEDSGASDSPLAMGDGSSTADSTLPDDPALRSAEQSLDEGRATLEKARKEQDQGRTRDLLEESLADLRAASEKLGGVDEPSADGEPSDGPHGRITRRTRDLLVQTHVELGYLEIVLGDRNSAYHHASLAAALDPEDPRVSDLRQAVGNDGVYAPGAAYPRRPGRGS